MAQRIRWNFEASTCWSISTTRRISRILKELRRRVLSKAGPDPFQLLNNDGAYLGIAHRAKCFLQGRVKARSLGAQLSLSRRAPNLEAVREELVARTSRVTASTYRNNNVLCAA